MTKTPSVLTRQERDFPRVTTRSRLGILTSWKPGNVLVEILARLPRSRGRKALIALCVFKVAEAGLSNGKNEAQNGGEEKLGNREECV